jgi:HK97 family phage prohead protease
MYIETHEWKALGKQDKSIKPSLRKANVSTTQAVGDRQIKFIFSTPQLDRDYDVITQEGIDVSHYTTNPVIFWNHLHDTLPIGKCISLGIENGCLTGIVEFVSFDNPEVGAKAEGVYQLARDGYLSTVSIGFIATEWKFADDTDRYTKDGADIQKCELVEVSIVGIPSNRGALIQEVGAPATVFEPIEITDVPKKYRAARLRRVIAAIE